MAECSAADAVEDPQGWIAIAGEIGGEMGNDDLHFVKPAESEAAAAPPEPRGVANPRVVDLIGLDAERDEVFLVMLEERPWGAESEQLRQLEDKFNAYLDYLLDGFLAREYPQYAGKRVRFQLDCATAPQGEATAFLNAARNYAEGEGIRFIVNVVQ